MKFNKIFISIFATLFLLNLPVLAVNDTEAKLEYNKGIDFYKLGQYDKAVLSFRKAIELNPDCTDAYYNLGNIMEYLGQDEEALTFFKQIVKRNPSDYESIYKAAELSKKLGYNNQAKEFLVLIPADSYVNSKAQKLAHSMNTDLQTIKYQNNKKEAPTQPKTNGIYENINSPTGMTTDNNGNLYIAGYSDNVIYKITPNGEKIVFLKNQKLNGPIGLVRDNKGNIYVANYNANNILKVAPNGTVTVIIQDVIQPYGLHISNGVLFVSSQGVNAVMRYKL